MKLKATQAGLSEECIAKLNQLRLKVLQEILNPHLKLPLTAGAAEFYVQECDHADKETHPPFCEVRLSGVSCTDERSYNDFVRARDALEETYFQIILDHADTNFEAQLFVSIMLDAPLKGSAIIEGKPRRVFRQRDKR